MTKHTKLIIDRGAQRSSLTPEHFKQHTTEIAQWRGEPGTVMLKGRI